MFLKLSRVPPVKIIFTLLAFLLFLGLFIQYQTRAPKRDFSDYRVYYDAGQNIIKGENIYNRESRDIAYYKYSPLFAVFMTGFSLLDKRTSANLFFILNIVSLIIIFWLSGKLIFFKEINPRRKYLIFTIVFVGCFRQILHCLHSGQVGLLSLVLIISGLYLITKGKDMRGSFLIGLSVMIKYMPFIFAGYFFLKRKYKIFFFMTLAVILYCLVPAIFIGMERNLYYLKEWLPYISATSFDEISLLDIKNYSLWTVARRTFPDIPLFQATLLAISAFFCLFPFIVFKRKRTVDAKLAGFLDCIDYGMILTCIPLFNANAWLHNFVALIFPYMLVIYYLFNCNFKDKLVLLLVFLSFLLSSFGSREIVGKALQTILEYSFMVTISTLILFIALARIKFRNKFLAE